MGGEDGDGIQRPALNQRRCTCDVLQASCHLDSCNGFIARQSLFAWLLLAVQVLQRATREKVARQTEQSHVIRQTLRVTTPYTYKELTWCFIKYAQTAQADRPFPLLQCTYLMESQFWWSTRGGERSSGGGKRREGAGRGSHTAMPSLR